MPKRRSPNKKITIRSICQLNSRHSKHNIIVFRHTSRLHPAFKANGIKAFTAVTWFTCFAECLSRESRAAIFAGARNRVHRVKRSLYTTGSRQLGKAFFHHTHTISRWRSQICGQKEIPKKFVSQKLAAQSGQFLVARPHIRGEHGILMIAF